MREIRRKAPKWGETLPALPGLAYETLKMARAGELEVRMRSEEVDRIRSEMRRANQRTVLAVIGAALLVGAAIILGLGGGGLATLWGAPVWSWILAGLGGCLALAALVRGWED